MPNQPAHKMGRSIVRDGRAAAMRVQTFDARIRGDLAFEVAPYDLYQPGDRVAQLAVQEVALYCLRLVDATAAYLTSRVKATVSLSVKFLWLLDEHKEPVLHTLCRSTNTKSTREASTTQDNFHYIENTAFQDILHGWPRVRSFSCDNLLDRWIDESYSNSNSDWMAFYNSTVVVPIPQIKDAGNLPVGFLCADSLLGKLDRPFIVKMVEEVSSHLYDVLGVLFSSSHRSDSPSSDERGRVVRLPGGWKYDGKQLVALDIGSQARFQRILERIEKVYSPERDAPTVLSAGQGALHSEERVSPMPDVDFLPGYDDLEYEGLSKERSEVIRPTAEEVDKILKRMAVHNSDAAEILKKRHKAQ